MCVSTGNAGWPKAWLMITLAVLCPTPGKASRSAKLSGTCPACRSTSSRAIWDRACAFRGASPIGRMIDWMRATGSAGQRPRVGCQGKQLGRDLIDFLVSRLGAEHHGYQQREGVAVVERNRRLGIQFLEASLDVRGA